MDIFSSSDVTHLPQSMLNVKSRNGLSYSSSAGGTPYVDFDLASSIGFYLASDLMLSFNFEYASSDGIVYNIRPSCNMGMNGLIRQVNIYSISDGVLLEEIQDNHVLGAALMSHNNGSDKEMKDGNYKKWSLTESYCGENDAQDITPFTTPNALPIDPTTPNPASPSYQTQTIQLPLRLSHLLGSEQVIPVGALGGLRIRLILNPPEIFNCLHADDMDLNVVTNISTLITSDKWSVPAGVVAEYPLPPEYITPDATALIPNVGGSISVDAGVTDFAVDATSDGGGFTAVSMVAAVNVAFDAATTAAGGGAGDLVFATTGVGTYTITNTTAADLDLSNSSLFDEVISTSATFDLQSAHGAMIILAGITTPDITYAAPTASLVVGSVATTYLADLQFLLALNNHFDSVTSVAGIITASNIAGSTAAGWTIDITNSGAASIADITINPASTLWDGSSLLDISTIVPALGAVNTLTGGVTYTIGILASAHSSAISTLNLKNSTLYLNNGKDLNTCPFKIGQKIVIKLDGVGYSNVSPVISNIIPSGVLGGIQLVWASPWDVGGLVTGEKNVKTSLPAFGVINYNITQMSMNVPVITPPPSYVVALQQAINSDEGMSMDVRAYAIQRSNVIAGQTMAAMNLNGLVAHKAKGILSIPYVVTTGTFDSVYCGDNLTFLNGTKYWYEYSGVKHPSRGINTDQTRQGSLSQEQIDQMVKSFEYCLDARVVNLDGFKDSYKHKTFFYGRNLGIFNSVYDAVAGNIQLVIEATNSVAGGASTTYTINHYCSAIYNIVMRPDGVVLLK